MNKKFCDKCKKEIIGTGATVQAQHPIEKDIIADLCNHCYHELADWFPDYHESIPPLIGSRR